MSATDRLGLAVLLLLGGALRFGGLSHDLHENRVYHPDTPKQLRAVQRFYAGQYFQHTGHKDYDGYPLFASHLVEHLCRLLEPARRGVLQLLGVPTARDRLLELTALYWLMLLLNAALSTAAIAVVWRIGRENFTRGAAWTAALLQALSPVDVTACHYATGDTAAAFFATASLLFALRIARLGRRRDYALAAALAVFGFAAKYHAGMAVFPLAAAHLTRFRRPADWFGRESLSRAALTAAAAAAALALAIPSLVTHFSVEAADILRAFGHSSSRVPPELLSAGRWEKFLYSMRHNLPVLWRILGPAALPAAALALASGLRRDARTPILLSLPAAYVLLGVGSKTLLHAVYHAVMTAPVFLLTAFVFARRVAEPTPRRRAAQAAAALLLLAQAAFLARGAARETFFQWHMDTRRMAPLWTAENVPAAFNVVRGRYTFSWHPNDYPGFRPQGTLVLRSRLGPLEITEPVLPLKRFALEREPLMQFRNVDLEAFLGRTAWLRSGFSLPLNARLPSQTGNQFIFDNGLELYRSGKVLTAAPGEGVARWLVRETPLPEAWLILQSSALPAFAKIGRASCRESV